MLREMGFLRGSAALLLFFFTLVAAAADDVLTLSSVSALPGSTAKVPVHIRDVSGTALDVNGPARIQVIELTVNFPASDAIVGCLNPAFPDCHVTFVPAGVLAGLTAESAETFLDSSSLYVRRVYNRTTNPIPFRLNGGPPGDLIGFLEVELDPEATPGELPFTFDPAVDATRLSDQTPGSVSETAGDGLLLVAGGITIPDCSIVPTSAQVAIGWTGQQSACSGTSNTSCRAGESLVFRVDTFQYTLGLCDSFLWSFGDGTTSTVRVPTKVYATSGTFPVTVKVTTAGGEVTAGPRTVPVGLADGDPCIACSAVVPGLAPKSSSVAFRGVTACPGATYSWDFGDQSGIVTSAEPIVTHSFASVGTYLWRLTITSPGGLQCARAGFIQIAQKRRSAKS